MNCPRCGREFAEDETTCRDCGFEVGALQRRLTRTARRRYQPTVTEFRSLYDRLGGAETVERAVDQFYERLMADERIRHFFVPVDGKRLRAKQRDFLSYAFGGPVTYRSARLRQAHRHLQLRDEHFTAVVEHLEATLVELGIEPYLVEEVVAIANATREDVLGRP